MRYGSGIIVSVMKFFIRSAECDKLCNFAGVSHQALIYLISYEHRTFVHTKGEKKKKKKERIEKNRKKTN